MTRTPTFDIYRDAGGQFRWRLRARNGRIIADGSEGYSDRRGVQRAFVALVEALGAGAIRDLTGIPGPRRHPG